MKKRNTKSTIKNKNTKNISKKQNRQNKPKRHYRRRSKMENLTGLTGIERQKVIIKNQNKVKQRAQKKINNATNKIKIMELKKDIKRS